MAVEEAMNLREEIPALSSSIYLDSAGAGLPPRTVTKAIQDIVDEWSRFGERWNSWIMDVVEARRLFATLVNCKESEVGLVPSVSSGFSELASCLRSERRKKVVTSSLNFPTNVIIWQRMREFGLLKKVEVIDGRDGIIPFERWEKAIDEDTLAVSIDYVSWLSGYREKVREIAEIAHKRGAYVFVDSFHAVGVFPVDVKKDGVDAMLCGLYKWLCGPHGVACIYVNNEFLASSEPAYIGWYGIEDNIVERLMQGRDAFDRPLPLDSARPSKTASRFEWGTWAMIAVRGAVEALRYALKRDPSYRFSIIRRRRDELIEGLEAIGLHVLAKEANMIDGSGIVTFKVSDHKAIVNRLAERNIMVSGRFNHIRVSPHFYNTGDEIHLFLETLKQLLKR